MEVRGTVHVPSLPKAVPEVQGWAFMWVLGVQVVFREPFRLSWVPPYRLQELLQHHVSLASF